MTFSIVVTQNIVEFESRAAKLNASLCSPANFVCLSGAGQVAYSGFMRAFLLKTSACRDWKLKLMRAVRVNKNIKVAGCKNQKKNELKALN